MRSLLLIALLVATGAATAAQQMPDLSQMTGRPLPAPELQTGMVSVRVVRERMGNNVVGQPVRLQAPGRTLEATTDAQGRATFGDVPVGTTITVATEVDGEALQSEPFTVPASGGVRVALIAGLAAAAAREEGERDAGPQQPARPGVVVFGGESRVILEFQNDNLQVFYLLDIVNASRAPVAVAEPLEIAFPEGASGAGALEGSSTLATVQNDRIRIAGPFPPGTTKVQVGYRYSYDGDTATLVQRWPATFEQLFVAAEKTGALQISSAQFKQQQEASAGGAPFLMATGGRINAGDTLTLQLSGLPYRPTLLRDVGIAVGVLVLVAGLVVAFRSGAKDRDQVSALTARRQALFDELVALDLQYREQRIDERRYTTRRQKLVAELETVLADLDRTPALGGGEGLAA